MHLVSNLIRTTHTLFFRTKRLSRILYALWRLTVYSYSQEQLLTRNPIMNQSAPPYKTFKLAPELRFQILFFQQLLHPIPSIETVNGYSHTMSNRNPARPFKIKRLHSKIKIAINYHSNIYYNFINLPSAPNLCKMAE